MKQKIFITQKIFPEIGQELSSFARVVQDQNTSALSRKAFIQKAKNAFGILSFLSDTIDEHVMASLPKLKIISNYAVGFNNIDVAAATQRGIFVCNTPGILTDTTANLTWTLILAVTRHIPQADRFTKEGRFAGWKYDLFLGSEITGRTLGILGIGRIGKAVAIRAEGFGMKVIYFSPSKRHDDELDSAWKSVDFETLLKNSDVLSIHAPLTKITFHLIGAKELAMMKPTAYLINTARGPIVDEKALLIALKKRKIAGAGLDVYEHEPKITPGLTKLPNVVCLPHIGSATVETRQKMAQLAAENIMAFFKGKIPPPNCVNLSSTSS